jgi:membrane-bound lytic murein transglycosylase F
VTLTAVLLGIVSVMVLSGCGPAPEADGTVRRLPGQGLEIAVSGDIVADDHPYAWVAEITRYDGYFRKYSKRFFGPAFDWKWFKAQGGAESRLEETATSHVGARGLMQVMPRTYDWLKEKNAYLRGSVQEARYNIAAGIYYDKRLWDFWEAAPTPMDRLNLMFASYNAGKTNIIRARNRAGNSASDPHAWRAVKQTLPDVTGRNSAQTFDYVDKIHTIREVLQ